MNLVIKKKNVLDFLILWLLILHVMIIRWFNVTGYFNLLVIILIAISMVRDLFQYINQKTIFVFILMISYMLINFGIRGGDFMILTRNIFEIMTPFLILIYLSHLMLSKKIFLIDFFKQCFWVLNIYTIINIPVLLLQLTGSYWLAGFTDTPNPFVPDLICGLLGYNGTPQLALFTSFIPIYNYVCYRFFIPKSYKTYFAIYNLFLVLFFAIISLFNDNKGYYLILAMFVAIYYIISNEAKLFSRKTITKFSSQLKQLFIWVGILSIPGYLLYRFTAVGNSIDTIFHEIRVGITYSNAAQGSNERIGMIAFSLQEDNNRLMGYGLGTYTWTAPDAFGFAHYGQSDLGTFLCLAGIIFLLLIDALIFYAFRNIYKNIYLPVVILIGFNVLAIFTQVFTVTSLMVSSMFFMISCWNAHELSIEESQNTLNNSV